MDSKLSRVQLHSCLKGVSQDKNDRISTEEHLGDVAVFVDRFGFLFAFASFWYFSPHLFYILHYHIAVPATKWSCNILNVIKTLLLNTEQNAGWQLMVLSIQIWYITLGDFTFWISLWLRPLV